MKLIIVIVLLLLLISLNAIMGSKVLKEKFGVEEALDLYALKRCGRNLSFPYFSTSNLTASQRALTDTSISTNPLGKCGLTDVAKNISNDSFAIVQEEGIFYTLKKTCMALKIMNYRMDGSKIFLDFSIDSKEDIKNLTKYLLLNPLFVEFTFGNIISIPYFPYVGTATRDPLTGRIFPSIVFMNNKTKLPGYLTNTDKSYITLEFSVLVPPQYQACDKAFNYHDLSPNQQEISQSMFNNLSNNVLNMWVYYLEDKGINFQQTGKELLVNNSKNNVLLFDKNYKNYYNDPTQIHKYEFMNNIAIMYHNYITPVLTFSFDICIDVNNRPNPGNWNGLIKSFVDNGYIGGWHPNCNNNIFAAEFFTMDSGYLVTFLVADEGNCGYDTYLAPPLFLYLPYLSSNTVINVTLTIGPNQKHVYAQWTDINSGDIGKKIAYGKSIRYLSDVPFNVCDNFDDNAKRDINNFTRIFASKRTKPRKSLENTYVSWNDKYVKKLKSVSLGYKNFNNLFADLQ